jgi:hypothetical protein
VGISFDLEREAGRRGRADARLLEERVADKLREDDHALAHLVGVPILEQALVVARQRDNEQDGVDITEDVDPLAALAPLATNIDNLVHLRRRSSGENDAGRQLWTRAIGKVRSERTMSLTAKVLSEMPIVVARDARMSLSVGANPEAQKRLAF